jgi:LytS/YehU family sensor histidine kinase
MLFIPFIENALKHSYIEEVEDSFIDIKLEQTSDKIYFEVRNSLSRKHTQKDTVGGIGIENVKRRLAIIYPGKHQLDISENGTIFSVILKIQLREDS